MTHETQERPGSYPGRSAEDIDSETNCNRLDIATAPRRDSKRWKRDTIEWGELAARLDAPAGIKECGNYVLGRLRNSKRSRDTLVSRSALTLDVDHAGPGLAEAVGLVFGYRALIHTTYSSTPDAPRFRVIVALSRDVTPDEYRHIARVVMGMLGPEQFDPGSAQPERYMFWPATQDQETYQWWHLDGDPLDVEAVLALPDPGSGSEDTAAAEVDLAEPPTAQELERASQRLEQGEEAVQKLRNPKNRDAGGRNRAVYDWLFQLYCFVKGACLDRDDVDTRIWEATQQAPGDHPYRRAEFDRTAGNAWGNARPTRPHVDDPTEDFEVVGSGLSVDVTNDADALDWLKREAGRGPLSGVLRQGAQLVYTPRIGESGYVPPVEGDADGPAQVQLLTPLGLVARVNHHYRVFRMVTASNGGRFPKRALFPQLSSKLLGAALDLAPGIRPLRGVTHTPMARPDGSILDTPGYDPDTGMLYLPDPTLSVLPVPDEPNEADVRAAAGLLSEMVDGFPFLTDHDRANYLGALLAPLLRAIVSPPYKLVAIGAPQRGSGKSFLAWILREVHGGVFRAGFKASEEERRKDFTTILSQTTAPVVTFDNVGGTLKSEVLEGLLTTADYSDRLLGANQQFNGVNDRLWTVTANNLHIGGDLGRRVLWVTIDANMERPEERHNFAIPDLKAWVRTRRAELLQALLTLIRAWAVAGMPLGEAPTSDDYGYWVAVLRGILSHAGIAGIVAHEATVQERSDSDTDEQAAFLAAAYERFGAEPWTTKELVEDLDFDEDTLPEAVVYAKASQTRALGKHLSREENRWRGGYAIRRVPTPTGRPSRWRVERKGDDA